MQKQIKRLIAQELKKQLTQFGLNPKEWSIKLNNSNGLQNIEIEHQEDAQIKFIGKAKIMRNGFGYKLAWNHLSLVSI